ncbi:hypothetical protein A5821_002684 [Enterococcus sp. 7F3_DIV0205]|uniref:WxL domain-containing protein n=1 Tax=Candidatus Enterococcus palustris TaxID=1834189 RepID=A0AAQ3WAF9_9ENTE|nr:WxL domain-containing protein [Enterococcus sp. 7F3_DIV0205]OTN83117.1 hypothetical protein A5821_003040 [Enterococcus sp. 7F3_DIV0205]
MKKKITCSIPLLLLSASIVFLADVQQVHADDSQDGNATIGLTQPEQEIGLRDPENPTTIVDPGPTPSTTGDLRIDFVPQLNFSKYLLSDKDQTYPVNAQLFKDQTGPRGNFVQVSDFRPGAQGWTLQVRQETQFKNDKAQNSQLNGAVISFDKSWVNATRDLSEAPTVSKEIIRLSNVGETYNLAEAKPGKGRGIWSISFGASKENKNGQPGTLSPRLLKEQPVLDPAFDNKQVYENSAIQLSIPGATKKDLVEYSTVLTWTIAELP